MLKIGLGTAAIGRPQYINIKQQNTEPFLKSQFIESGKQVLNSAYENGIRYYDTAPGYGLAEQLLLDWVKEKNDASIEVASKWGYAYVADFNPNAKVHEVKDHSLHQLNQQWQQTEKLLPYLSTLQIHSATFETGVLHNQAVLERLAELKSDYKIFIGLTTTGDNQVDVIKAALNVTVDGNSLFDTFQVTYNILDQSLIEVAYLLKNSGKRIIIKEALANGRIFRNDRYPHYSLMFDALDETAKKYAVGVDAVALRFCLQSIEPNSLLSGASLVSQIVDNLKSNNFSLTDEEMTKLKAFKLNSKVYWDERKQLSWN